MQKLKIITVHKGNIDKLKNTLESTLKQSCLPHKHLIISPTLPTYFKEKFNKKIFEFIIGKDKSLYNAMNLGLRSSFDSNIFFLNSGDKFASEHAIKYILNELNKNQQKILVYPVVLKYKNINFFPKKKYFLSSTYFPHPGFIRPSILQGNKKHYFSEKYMTIADGIWIKENLKSFNYKKKFKYLIIHELGGISTIPTFSLAKEKFKKSYIEFLKEFIKIVLYKILTKTSYYKLIYINKYNFIEK